MSHNHIDYNATIRDSIETSLKLKLFTNKNSAMKAHIYKSQLVKFPMSLCKTKLHNFNPNRLQSSTIKAYPLNNRPREKNDIISVNFYIKQIKNKQSVSPIYIFKHKKKYTLLDGAHRIVAHYIKHKQYVYAYIVQ